MSKEAKIASKETPNSWERQPHGNKQNRKKTAKKSVKKCHIAVSGNIIANFPPL